MTYNELCKYAEEHNLDEHCKILVKYTDVTYSFISTYKWVRNVYTEYFCTKQHIKFLLEKSYETEETI